MQRLKDRLVLFPDFQLLGQIDIKCRFGATVDGLLCFPGPCFDEAGVTVPGHLPNLGIGIRHRSTPE
jgi:hypothetical protein